MHAPLRSATGACSRTAAWQRRGARIYMWARLRGCSCQGCLRRRAARAADRAHHKLDVQQRRRAPQRGRHGAPRAAGAPTARAGGPVPAAPVASAAVAGRRMGLVSLVRAGRCTPAQGGCGAAYLRGCSRAVGAR